MDQILNDCEVLHHHMIFQLSSYLRKFQFLIMMNYAIILSLLQDWPQQQGYAQKLKEKQKESDFPRQRDAISFPPKKW